MSTFDRSTATLPLSPEQIAAIRDYLLDLECPFTESSVNALCDMALASLVPSAELASSGDPFFQQFDCHYDGDINRCDKDCRQLGECKRRTTGKPVSSTRAIEPLCLECEEPRNCHDHDFCYRQDKPLSPQSANRASIPASYIDDAKLILKAKGWKEPETYSDADAIKRLLLDNAAEMALNPKGWDAKISEQIRPELERIASETRQAAHADLVIRSSDSGGANRG